MCTVQGRPETLNEIRKRTNLTSLRRRTLRLSRSGKTKRRVNGWVGVVKIRPRV